MVLVKCEFCNHEQDDEVSKICDKCGGRLGRTGVFQANETSKEAEDGETTRCPIYGAASSKVICPDCGNHKRTGNI